MPVILMEAEELQELIRRVVAEEVKSAVTGEITRFLSQPEEDRLLTRSQAMQQLGIRTRDTMLKLEKGGDLYPIRIGGKIYYQLVDLQKLKAGRER